MDLPLEYLKKHRVYSPAEYPKYGTTLKPDHRFVTKPGKIELFSERLQGAGYDPLPVYHPPSEAPTGKFRLALGRHAFHTHANTTNYPWPDSFAPENTLRVHPKRAAALGVRAA